MKAKAEGSYLIRKMSVLMWLLQKIFIGVENWKKIIHPEFILSWQELWFSVFRYCGKCFLAFFSDFTPPAFSKKNKAKRREKKGNFIINAVWRKPQPRLLSCSYLTCRLHRSQSCSFQFAPLPTGVNFQMLIVFFSFWKYKWWLFCTVLYLWSFVSFTWLVFWVRVP